MMTVTTTCAKCSAKIFAEAPQEFCSACFLETGLGLLAEEPVTGDNGGSASPRTITSRNCGRERVPPPNADGVPRRTLGDFGDYELLEEIGRGGQGIVYRARQKSLNRTVALKVIGLGQWATEAHVKRFRREAEAAAQLDHPGIVPIYEVGERDGQCYFSMKFIEGGQLDEVVRREPMSTRRAAELLVKIARTVQFAHEHGILHRDIKPGNILLDRQGEPHLTDFGLALLLEQESTITHSSDVLGTPSYMSPEQAAGRTKDLTAAADVYSLGAVFYQMLTGEPPFAGGTSYETIRLLLNTEPRKPRVLNRKIDRDLSTICLKCLEKDPKRRYPAAAGLAEDLERWLKHEPIQAHRTGIFTRGRKWVQRKPAIAAVIALSVAFGAAMGWNIWKSELISHPVTKGIAVLPFENLSGDPDNAYFADGMQEEILTRLAKITDLKVISRTSTQHYHSKARNLAEIAKQLGVTNILEGSVQKAADRVRVNVQLINAQTDSHLWAESYDRKLIDVLGVESEIAKRVAESLQARLTGQEQQALAVKPTTNPEAYDAYLRGLSFEARNYFTSYSQELEGKAAASYERAVQLDPNFAVAWARLSRSNAHIYFAGFFESTSTARRDTAKRALDNAQRLAPNSSDTLLALGYYQYWVLRDYGAAKTTFERVNKMSPGSSEVPRAKGFVARREGRWDESIAYFERALAVDPRNAELLTDAAETYAMLRQFPAALRLYVRTLDIMPNDPDLMARKATIYQAQGNLQEAARFLSAINEQTPSGPTFEVKVIQLRLERNYGEAIRLLRARQAQFHYSSDNDKAIDQIALAFFQRLAGDTPGAKVTAEQARNALEPVCKDQSDNFGGRVTTRSPLAAARLAAQLSQSYAAIGEKESALKAAERAIMLLPSAKDWAAGPGYEENLALIQTIFGENSRAISTLTQLLKTPYSGTVYASRGSDPRCITLALLRLDPIWDPLRTDPAFQKLCEEKQPPATP